LKNVPQTSGRVSNEPPVPAPPTPKNDTAWERDPAEQEPLAAAR
jgi:hypothetical protein